MPVCELCTKSFPNNLKIDGVWKMLNKRKFCLECSPYKEHNTRRLTEVKIVGVKKCLKCGEDKKLEDFYRNGKHSYCVPCSKKDSFNRKQRLKEFAVEYKGGACQACGYNKCIDALEFHHENREQKEFSISSKTNGISLERLKKELDKCTLYCCRCHREREFELKSNQK